MQSKSVSLVANETSYLASLATLTTEPHPPQPLGSVVFSIILRVASVRLRNRAVEMELRSKSDARQDL